MAVCLSLLGSALLPGHPASADLSTDVIVQGFAAPWADSFGAAHVMGEVKVLNSATSNYRDLVVSCTLVDAAGATQTQTADVQATILTPGEKAPFDAVFPGIGTGFTQPNCTMFGGATTTLVPNHDFSAQITLVQISPVDGLQHVTGTLTNHNSVDETNVKVTLTSYDPNHPGTVLDEGVTWVDAIAGNDGTQTFDMISNLRPWDTNPSDSASISETLAPEVQLSTDSLAFDDQVKGTTSPEQTLYVRNVGTADLHIGTVSPSGPNAADFLIAADDHCSNKTLISEASCSMGVIFVPQATGPRVATLNLNHDASGSPSQVPMSGNGLARPSLSLSNPAVQFGGLIIGTADRVPLTITSNGQDAATISSMTLDDSVNFHLDPGNCLNTVMSPPQACQAAVTFQPTVAGPLNATLTIRSNARQDPLAVPLSGSGTQAVPGAALSATGLDFGNQLLNTTSGPQTVTLTSTGNVTLNISSISVVPTGEFSQTNTCPAALAAGTTCTITVTFTPSASGARAGSLTVTDDVPGNGTQSIPLTGAGVTETDFYFAEGFTGAGFSEQLRLLMPNHSGMAMVDYYLNGGVHLPRQVALVAGQVATVDVNSVVGPTQEVSVKVTLPFPGVAERVMHFNANGWYGSTDIVGVTHPASEWDFAEGSTLPIFSEYLTLQNPNDAPVAADIHYFTDTKQEVTRRIVLPMTSRTTINVATDPKYGVGGSYGGVSAQVIAENGAQIIAERPFYVNNFSFGAGAIRDGHVAFGANAPATTWNFAEGTTLPGFNEYLTLENPGGSDAHVTLHYVDDTGTSTPRALTVAKNSRATVEVFGTSLGVGVGHGGVSVQVTSDVPIVAERPMYSVHDFGYGRVAGATVVVGSTTFAKLFAFASVSALPGESDYLTLQNQGDSAATVQITYYTPTGPVHPLPVTVNAHQRVTLEVFSTGQLGRGTQIAGVVLSSDQPILVEKPTYSASGPTYGATDTLGYSPPSLS